MLRIRSAGRLVALALACVMLASATDLLHPREWDVCEIVPAPHDAGAHRWSADEPPACPDGGHCFLCHWLRSFGSALAPAGRLAADRDPSHRLRLRVLLPDSVQDVSTLSARAPPV